jgi:hypothetical protein
MRVGVWSADWTITYLYTTVQTFSVVLPPPPPSVTIAGSSVSQNLLTAGDVQNTSVTIASATGLSNLIVDLMIYDSAGTQVGMNEFTAVSIAGGTTANFTYDFASAASLPPGTYEFRVGVWDATRATTNLFATPQTFSVVAPLPPPPPPTPSVTIAGSSVSQNPLVAGDIQSTSVTIASATSLSGLNVDIRIYNSSSTQIVRKGFTAVSVAAGGTATLTYDYQSLSSLPPGTYTMRVGVWSADWTITYLYTTVQTFSVVAGTPPPPPPTEGVSYPFGSRLTPYVAGIRPTNVTQAIQDQAVINLYNSWKTTLVAGCGGYYVKFRAPYAAVSEGIGYGMLITVVMEGYDPNAHAYFDGLFNFARAHPAYSVDPNLMDWRINADCTSAGDGWNALDGDLDIAMGLLMADRQWGSAGAINYKAEAIKTINAMKAKNFNVGGFPYDSYHDVSRTSDYMIGHFRAFKKATGDAFWDTAINKSFELMSLMQSQFAPSTGLIPDFIVGLLSNPAPSPGNRIESTTEGYYAWNACRDPWRLASDYVTSGDVRSRDVAGKVMDFMNSTTGGNPVLIPMGWKLDGTPLTTPDPWYASPAFAGPALAGALVDARFQNFLNSLWTLSVSQPANGYYDYELQLISMMVASGNWWNP